MRARPAPDPAGRLAAGASAPCLHRPRLRLHRLHLPRLRLSGLALLAALLAAPFAALPAFAQDGQRLADIRAGIAALGSQLATLRQELVASGSGSGTPLAGSALERMDAMEAQLAQLTAHTEELGLRIERVVQDGTNRLGDLEFRLCEVEPGCDLASVGQTSPLGGAAPGIDAGLPASGPAPVAETELAVGERADFDRAREVLGQGDFRSAADLFATFAETYPGSPLSGEALYFRGEALMGAGDVAGAARAWLTSFSDYPQGPRAAESLLKLGQALGRLGQTPEACVTLDQVAVRYPGSAAASEAQSARGELGCM